MNRMILACALFALAAVGCDVGTAVSPLNEATSEFAGKASPMVPLQARAMMAVAGEEMVDCTYDGVSIGMTTLKYFSILGNYTHLGRTTGLVETEVCWIDGSYLRTAGEATLVSADGDEVHMLWGGRYDPPDAEGNVAWVFDGGDEHGIVITGGTGRFDGASGWAEGGGSFSMVELVGPFTIEGVISRVGSLN